MLIHSALTVSSEAHARRIFEEIFKFKLLYTFHIDSDIFRALFQEDTSAEARVYDMGNSQLEVFIIPNMPSPGTFQHICLEFPDRDIVINAMQNEGYEIRRYQRKNSEVVFAIDNDANLYELKTKPVC